MFQHYLSRSSTSATSSGVGTPVRSSRSATPTPAQPQQQQPAGPMASVHVKTVSLTSKKNWWLVEMDDEEDFENSNISNAKRQNVNVNGTSNSFSSSEETAVMHEISSQAHTTHTTKSHYQSSISQPYADIDPGSRSPSPSPSSSPRVFHIPDRHPSVIFSFPTPTAYAAPPNATANLAPYATGSTSELFKCIVKKPEVVQLEINGELQSNASDVTTQFLAELRVFTTVAPHRNIVAFLGCLEGVGMVLENIEGRPLLDVVRARPPLTKERKVDFHNQLLDGLAHIHSYGLSHGDLSLLNVFVTPTDTLKLLDFGRSVAADSFFESPSAEPEDPFALIARARTSGASLKAHLVHKRKIEQIHLGTRPFTAPEVIRGECRDAILADAYSFGVMLVCLDLCVLVDVDPAIQARDIIPSHFLEGTEIFRDRILVYLQPIETRRRILRDDLIAVKHWWDD